MAAVDVTPWSRVKSEIYALIGRNPKSNRMVVREAGLRDSQAILDVGCGPGAAVRGAAPHVARAVGVDRSEPMIEIARRRSRSAGNVEFAVAAAEDLPYADGEFDLVWTIHAFHHWERPDDGITEVRRVLRSGGEFMVVETETNGKHGLSRAAAHELARRFEGAGFGSASVTKQGKQLVVAAMV